MKAKEIFERSIVSELIGHVKKDGFEIVAVYDNDQRVKLTTEKEAIDLIFNLDEAHIYFKKEGFVDHYVYLVLGNGSEIISDYSFNSEDDDGFYKSMDQFTELQIEKYG